MLTLNNLYKLKQLASSHGGDLVILSDLLSAAKIHNLNFFDLLSRKPQRAFQEYERLYREDFLSFADTFFDIIERQFPKYTYLQDIIYVINDYYTRLDLEISATSAEVCDYSWFEKEYFSPLDTLFWGMGDILDTLGINSNQKNTYISTNNSYDNHLKIDNFNPLDYSIQLFGQKIYKNTDEIVDIEILARMTSKKDGKLLMPDDFLPAIEGLGMVSYFDWQVLEESFRFIGKNPKKITFSINVNPVTFQEMGFIDEIQTLVSRYGIQTKHIVLEVLEYGEVKNSSEIDVIFGKLREIGFKIAIDDYPSGYNTLAFITRFKNIDIVKVDGMHVVNMYKTCHLCQHVDTCIQPFLRDTRVTDKWHCLKRLQEKYDLESLVQSFRFLKILYPNIIFFAERIEDESIYAFFNKIPSLIAGYQGYYFQLPEGISNVCDLLTEKQISDVFSELPTVTNVVPRKKERRTYIRVKKTGELVIDEPFLSYVLGLEKFCFSIIELGRQIHPGDIEYSKSLSLDFSANLKNIMLFLSVNAINLYYVRDEVVERKYITIKGKVELYSMPLYSSLDISMIDKQFVNFYSLYHGQKNISHAGHNISHIPVQNLGDDIVVKMFDDFYIGIDDVDNAKSFNKQIQISLFMLVAIELGRIYKESK